MGIFIYIIFTKESISKLIKYFNDLYPNEQILNPKDIHLTLMCSDETSKNTLDANQIQKLLPKQILFTKMDSWQFSETHRNLLIQTENLKIKELHNYIKDILKINHYKDPYISHISLSYNFNDKIQNTDINITLDVQDIIVRINNTHWVDKYL